MSNLNTLKPFQSGHDPRRNTKGRPKGSKNKNAILELAIKYLQKEVMVNGHKMTKEELIAHHWVDDMVLRRNYKAINMFLDRTEGKVKSARSTQYAPIPREPMTDEEYEELKKLFPNHQEGSL